MNTEETMDNPTYNIVPQSIPQGEIVLYQPDETVSLEVRLEDDTVWLTQAQMAELFQTTRNNVTLHIGNIFKEGELTEYSVRKDSLLTASDGKKYHTWMYNLDVIISVGYRVKSKRGTQFRQWANQVIKNYMLHGYAINQQLQLIEHRMDARLEAHTQKEQQHFSQIESTLADHQDKIDFFVRTNMPPVEGIFYDGQIFDAYAQIADLIKQAKKTIVLIDNYIDETTLTLLGKRKAKVKATIYTRPLSAQQQLDVQRYNQQYPPITVHTCQKNHDRFLIIDDVPYLFGASLKDAGKRLFAYIKMQETTAKEILSRIA